MRILITGANGFCGRHLIHLFQGENHEIIAHTGRSPMGLSEYQNVEVYSGDLSDGWNFPSNIDVVVHTAAVSPGPGVKTKTQQMIRANSSATDYLAQRAADVGVKTFIFLSTISVFGQIDTDVLDETSPIIDPCSYGMSKRLGELALRERAFSSLSIRLPSVLGHGAKRHWISTLLEDSHAGRDISYFNADSKYNNAVHVDDLCSLISKVVQNGCQGHDIVTLAASAPLLVREMVDIIINAGGGKSKSHIMPSRKKPFLISSERASKIYGYAPMSLRKMLNQYIDAYNIA